MNTETIKGYTVHGRIGGLALHYTRRQYAFPSGQTFTFIEYYNGTDWISLGDPWPSASVSPDEIRDQIDRIERGKCSA
jgi:hypothetical protein